MKLSDETIAVMKCFGAINTNLVIQPGKKFSTVSAGKDILAEYEGADEFPSKVSLFNLNELLGVIASFKEPEITLDTKMMTIKEGKTKVTYMFAEESLLTTPQKSIKMPEAEVEFKLAADDLSKIQKMAGILAVEDIAIIGDGKKLVAMVYDKKNPTGNNFEMDLSVKSAVKFKANFKVEKFSKLFAGDYDVSISSKKISKFANSNVKLVVYLAVESDSEF